MTNLAIRAPIIWNWSCSAQQIIALRFLFAHGIL